VFFAERPGGPYGSLNVPVTPLATIATDKKVYPPALPAFVVIAPGPEARGGPWRQFMLDQDTGGAIRGPVRGDLFWGFGPHAAERAGMMKDRGTYYLLLPRNVAARAAVSS